MIKLNKIIVLTIVLFLVFAIVNSVNASTINMDLSNDVDQTTYGSETSNTNRNATSSARQQSSVVVSNSNQNTTEGLTISDMINIILCAVGIILILLGIAILIRQKG